MPNLNREIDRVLTLLRNKIREQGFTQLLVQSELGWGRSYISQLLTRQKALRMEQILSVLWVIGVPAADFFGELYGFDGGRGYAPGQDDDADTVKPPPDPALVRELEQARAMIDGFSRLLVDKGFFSPEELEAAKSGVDQAEPD